jgi:DNA-binding NtrC family response regulator
MAGPIRVLHVDDDPDLADVTATFLEREDEFAMDTANSVDDALDPADPEFLHDAPFAIPLEHARGRVRNENRTVR